FNGAIVFVGAESEWQRSGSMAPGVTVVDAQGGAVVPGFVDAHTHAIFAGDRRGELRRRLAGATYAEIASNGGGTVAPGRATRDASERTLVAETQRRLEEMVRCGTTTCEIKSGYGLTTDSELKLLRAIGALAADPDQPMELVPTFMGAHEVPVEYRDRR